MKRSDFLKSLENLLPDLPRLSPVGIGAPLQFSSSGGGGRYDDPDDYYDEIPEEPEPPRRRSSEERATAARQRTVQSDPDDRYWTDYLRIALPVIGLLLVIAVFWFWAQQLIDNNGEDTPATEPGLAEVVETATVAPTEEAPAGTETTTAGQAGESLAPQGTPPEQEQQQQALPSPTPPPENTGTGTDNQVPQEGGNTDQTGQQPPADGAGGGEIAPETTVVVTEEGDGLNLRSEPTSAEENVVTVLDAGTELTVLSGPEETENYIWWEVSDPAGNQGWVVEEFIQPAG